MKKFVSLLLAAVLLLSLCLTGCNRNNSPLDPKNPVVLNMWHNYGGDMQTTMDYLIDQFNVTVGKEKGIVMDGRDIGTTVFPDAELKIFVTATPEIRAQRRYDELKAKGQEASFDEILENVKQRDYIDQNREVSPLRKAEDALLLDNTHLSIEEQKEWLFGQFNKVSK